MKERTKRYHKIQNLKYGKKNRRRYRFYLKRPSIAELEFESQLNKKIESNSPKRSTVIFIFCISILFLFILIILNSYA